MTPWMAMSCQVEVAKDERMRAVVETKRPRGPKKGQRRGYRVKRVKVRGAERYRIPCGTDILVSYHRP